MALWSVLRQPLFQEDHRRATSQRLSPLLTRSVELYGLRAHRVLDAQRRGARAGHSRRKANSDRAIPVGLAASPAVRGLTEVARVGAFQRDARNTESLALIVGKNHSLRFLRGHRDRSIVHGRSEEHTSELQSLR